MKLTTKKINRHSIASIVLIIIFVVSCYNLSAQQQQTTSKIKIAEVSWLADGKSYSMVEGLKGISKPDTLKLKIIFEEKPIELINQKDLTFEIKWYRYGPSKRYLTDAFVGEIQQITNADKKSVRILLTSRGNLKSGVMDIEIKSYFDQKLIEYDGKQVFQIVLK